MNRGALRTALLPEGLAVDALYLFAFPPPSVLHNARNQDAVFSSTFLHAFARTQSHSNAQKPRFFFVKCIMYQAFQIFLQFKFRTNVVSLSLFIFRQKPLRDRRQPLSRKEWKGPIYVHAHDFYVLGCLTQLNRQIISDTSYTTHLVCPGYTRDRMKYVSEN